MTAHFTPDADAILDLLDKPIVMIGLMGAGKTKLGGMLATALSLSFTDSDKEIEKAAGLTIPEIFSGHGERAFRDLERKILERLLSERPSVIATGGGAVTSPETAARIWGGSVSIWLDADLSILVRRSTQGGRAAQRPLLANGDPRTILASLMREREPLYAQANIRLDTGGQDMNKTIQTLLSHLRTHLEKERDAR